MKRIALMIFLVPAFLCVNAQSDESLTTMLADSTLNIDEVEREDDVVFVCHDDPKFPGGMGALMKFVQDSLRYPVFCLEQGIQGRVIVQFLVNPDSTLSDIRVVKSVYPHLDNEALRLVKSMPKWIPARQYGKPVQVRFTMPINFRLPKEES